MDSGIVALVIRFEQKRPLLMAVLSDTRDIQLLEKALTQGHPTPLDLIGQARKLREQEDEAFGDYVENLLSQPFLERRVQEQGVRWLQSKAKIEQFERSESEAAQVIAQYAFQYYCQHPEKDDFLLVGAKAKVRIRVFVIPDDVMDQGSRNQIAA